MANARTCGDGCAEGAFFRTTRSGWESAGTLRMRPCELTAAGMSGATARRFSASCEISALGVIKPGDTGDAVRMLQRALVAFGYPTSVDGEFGPRTEAAVRDFQGRNGLTVDGLVGPQTQYVLGIGPDPATGDVPSAPAPTDPPVTATDPPPVVTDPPATDPPATDPPATDPPATDPPVTDPPVTDPPVTDPPVTDPPVTDPPPPVTSDPGSLVIVPGEPFACTVERINSDTGMALVGEVVCHGGWAVVRTAECAASSCDDGELFRADGTGTWVFDSTRYRRCADALVSSPSTGQSGMAPGTALLFARACSSAIPTERTNILAGSAPERIHNLQVALVALGYPLQVDSTYGPLTEAAVRDFQSRNGLEVDGIAGPMTQEALGL